jgi:hypothetical protein
MHSVNDNTMPPNILIVSSQSQERDTYTHSSSAYYLCFSICVSVCVWYHLGPRKQKNKNTLMTAIRHSCSCTHTYIHMMVTCRKEKEKKTRKVLILYVGERRRRKNSFQLINSISSIIIEMSSACLKFETYRYKRVNDRHSLMSMMKTSEYGHHFLIRSFMQSHQ